ncbi:hypothetical protein LCGC14_0962130, partial [marine sediment metagenome]
MVTQLGTPITSVEQAKRIVSRIPTVDVRTFLASRGGGDDVTIALEKARLRALQIEAARVAAAKREAARREAARKAAAEAARKAREEAARKARQQALKKVQEDAKRRKLSFLQRQKLISKELARQGAARRREELLAGKTSEEQIKILKEKVAKNLFIEQRVVDTVKRKGKEIPIIETVIVDERGNVIRKATTEERKIVRETGQRLLSPEEEEKLRDTGKKDMSLLELLIDPSKAFIKKGSKADLLKLSPETLTRSLKEINRDIEKAEQDIQAGRSSRTTAEVRLTALALARLIVENLLSIKQIPQTTVALGKAIPSLFNVNITPSGRTTLTISPNAIESITKIPAAIQRGGAKIGQTLRISPTTILVKIGGEILIMKGLGKVLKVTGKLTSTAVTRLSPRFRKIVKNVISIPSRTRGQALKAKITRIIVGKKGKFKVGKILKLKVSPKLGRLSLKKQIALARKEVTAVSAQADRLVNFLKTKRVVRKPFRREASLSKAAKKLLEKFDKGTITKKELIKLDSLIRKEGQKGLLERAFFADPKGVVRKRFLKIATEKEASLLDILSGDVTFKARKPQILVFEKAKVQPFPKTKIFKSIKSKLKAGKVLTKKEAQAWIEFQFKTTGRFKPVGFAGTEAEIIAAPGEIIKKVKTIGVTLVDGKRVTIVSAKLIKAKSATRKLLSKARKGKLTTKELKKLKAALKKETGFQVSLDSS